MIKNTKKLLPISVVIMVLLVMVGIMGAMSFYSSHMSAISQISDSYFGGDVDDLGKFKKSYGNIYFEFYRDFGFLKDADGTSTYILDIQYPNGNWDRVKETGYGTYFRIGKQYSDYFGETKGIKFTVKDNPDNNYIAPLGVYKGYVGFFESSGDMGDAPLDSVMLISEVYEFKFEVVEEQQPICTEGYKKCIGDTIYECVNDNFESMKGCGWECVDDGQGNAYCEVHPTECGDGSCAPDENQLTCPEDCTPACEYDDRRCENDRWMQVCLYNSYDGIYEWSRIDDCYPKKCVTDLLGMPYCADKQICESGDMECSTDKRAILVCKNNNWVTESCEDDNPLTIGKCETTTFGLGEPKCVQVRIDTCDSANDCDDGLWYTVDTCDKTTIGGIIGSKGLCSHFDIMPILLILGTLIALGIMGVVIGFFLVAAIALTNKQPVGKIVRRRR